MTLMAFYLHLGPYARTVIAAIDERLAELESSGEVTSRPIRVPVPDEMVSFHASGGG
jgi:hypothetical protein